MSKTMTRDPDADAWIGEMERMRDQCIELITSRFAMVIQSLDVGESEGEVTAVIFVADDERVGLSDALMNLLVITRPNVSPGGHIRPDGRLANRASAEFSYHRGHQIDVAFDAAEAGQIRDVAEALA